MTDIQQGNKTYVVRFDRLKHPHEVGDAQVRSEQSGEYKTLEDAQKWASKLLSLPSTLRVEVIEKEWFWRAKTIFQKDREVQS